MTEKKPKPEDAPDAGEETSGEPHDTGDGVTEGTTYGDHAMGDSTADADVATGTRTE